MSNNNRNKYVVNANMESVSVRDTLRLIDSSLPNIVETERDKIFEISYLLKDKGIDFWDDNLIFRNIVLYGMSLKTIEGLSYFKDVDTSFKTYLKNKGSFFKRAIREYKKVNDSVKNYDITKQFYELCTKYCKGLYPSSDMKDRFYFLYINLCTIGRSIGAVETEEFNNERLFSVLEQKEHDVDILNKAFMDIDDLTTEEFIEIVETGIRNHMQMFESMDKDYYDDMKVKYDNMSNKKRFLKK